MKKIFIFIIVAMVAGFSGSCKEKEIDGGWTSLDTDSASVKESAAFIKKELGRKHPDIKTVRVVHAEVQTVAGENFKFKIEYTSDTNRTPKVMKVRLFLSLEGKYSIDEIKFE